MTALEYNRDLDLDHDTIVSIQETVSGWPDGEWSPALVAKIGTWSGARGLAEDGRVTEEVLEAFRTSWAADLELEGDEALDDPDPASVGKDEIDEDDTLESVPPSRAEALMARKRDVVEAAQHDLFAFGFEPGTADGLYGSTTAAALRAFQTAAGTGGRLVGFERRDVEVTFAGEVTGDWDPATVDEMNRWTREGFRYLPVGSEYMQRRVRVDNYGRMRRSSVLLADVPSATQTPRRMHRLAAAALRAMVEAAAEDGLELKAQSGWRAHRWKSLAHYNGEMKRRYGSVSRGRRLVAYQSPHETGLAVDFGSEGLFPTSRTRKQQFSSPGFAWLEANAWRFGFHPYQYEPWHWEFPISKRAWALGESDWA